MLIPVRTAGASAGTLRTAVVDKASAETWVLAGLTLLGAALRFATLTSQSLWYDEALTVHELHMSFGAMLSAITTNEVTPPLYFLVAWPWTHIFGGGTAGLRSLSAVAGTAVIPIAYLCGRELVSRNAGLMAAAIAAVNPFLIWYSQEARAYALFAALSGASFLYFARAWHRPDRRNLARWAVFSGLAVLTHFFAGFLVGPEALLLLWRARSRDSVIAVGVVALSQASLLPMVLSRTQAQLSWIASIPLSIRIKQVPIELGLGSLYQSSLITKSLLGAAVLAVVVIALLAVGGERTERRGAALAAVIAGAVVLAPLVLALLGRDYFLARNLTAAWIPVAVVLGAACAVPRARIAGAALASVLLVGSVIAESRISADYQYQKPDWRAVASALGASASQRAIAASGGGFAAWPLSIYMPGVAWTQTGREPVTVNEVDVVASTWQAPAPVLPRAARLISASRTSEFLVLRFAVTPALHLTRHQIGAWAGALVSPAASGQAVLIQRPS